MRKFIILLTLAASTTFAFARTVKTDTIVCNSGTTVNVGLSIDKLDDLGASAFVINYEPSIVVCMGVENAEAVDPKDITYSDTGSGQLVIIFSKFKTCGGTLAKLKFHARSGTEGQFSDITIAEADLSAKDGVSDVTFHEPTKVVNGMIRVMGKTASVKRLEEAFVIQAKTELSSIAFKSGDAIQASGDKGPIVVNGEVSSMEAIPVKKPSSGWISGRYEILTTPTQGLSLALEGTDAIVQSETKEGLTTYFATLAIEGEVEIAALSGEISSETAAEIMSLIATELEAHPEVSKVEVEGSPEVIAVAADLGIAPKFDVLGNVATATYRTPEIFITDFDPGTGRVGMKVIPGEGNEIRSNLAVGCIHVYGTSNLSEKMHYISGVSIDLTPYLQTSTKGEANLMVSLGSHTFIKIKAETLIKQEGELE